MSLRYSLYNVDTGEFLQKILYRDDTTIVSKWTHRREKALKFPGTRSAKSMANALKNVKAAEDVRVINRAGEVIA